jgi:ATP-binding cassette subfamily B multidrug efflux pump
MADIVDIGVVQGDTNYILRVGGLMLLVAAAGAVCRILAANLSSKTAMGFGKILRRKVFSHVTEFSLSEVNKIGTASLITRTTNDITQIQMLVMVMLRMMVMAPMMLIGGIIMAVSQDASLARIIILIIPVIVGAVIVVMRKSTPLFKAMQEKLDKVNRVLRENLTGIRVVRAFNRIDFEKERFNEANLDLTTTAIRVNRIMAAAMPLMMVAMNFASIAILWFGGIRVDQGSMQVGSLMAFIQYIMQIMFSLVMVSMMFVMIPRASASAVRINEVLDTVAEIQDREGAKTGCVTDGHIEFRNVTFSYPGAEKAVLTNISFDAKPGEMTAIIGGTGSGKSTLVNLIESSPLTSVRYVVTDSAVKQPCILENHTKDRTQVPAGKLSDVNTVNCYPSAIYFVEPHEQVHKGGLACSCRAYNSDCLSRFHIYVHILNERNILLITETHAVECHFSPGSLYDFSVLFVRHLFRFIKEFKDAFCRCDSRLYDIGDIRS